MMCRFPRLACLLAACAVLAAAQLQKKEVRRPPRGVRLGRPRRRRRPTTTVVTHTHKLTLPHTPFPQVTLDAFNGVEICGPINVLVVPSTGGAYTLTLEAEPAALPHTATQVPVGCQWAAALRCSAAAGALCRWTCG